MQRRVRDRRQQDTVAKTKGAIARPAGWRDQGWGDRGRHPRGNEDSCARCSLWSAGSPARFARATRGQHCGLGRHHSRGSPCQVPTTTYAGGKDGGRSSVPTAPGGRATSSDNRQAEDRSRRPSRMGARHLSFAGKQRTGRLGANILRKSAAIAAHQDIDTDVRQSDERHRHQCHRSRYLRYQAKPQNDAPRPCSLQSSAAYISERQGRPRTDRSTTTTVPDRGSSDYDYWHPSCSPHDDEPSRGSIVMRSGSLLSGYRGIGKNTLIYRSARPTPHNYESRIVALM